MSTADSRASLPMMMPRSRASGDDVVARLSPPPATRSSVKRRRRGLRPCFVHRRHLSLDQKQEPLLIDDGRAGILQHRSSSSGGPKPQLKKHSPTWALLVGERRHYKQRHGDRGRLAKHAGEARARACTGVRARAGRTLLGDDE